MKPATFTNIARGVPLDAVPALKGTEAVAGLAVTKAETERGPCAAVTSAAAFPHPLVSSPNAPVASLALLGRPVSDVANAPLKAAAGIRTKRAAARPLGPVRKGLASAPSIGAMEAPLAAKATGREPAGLASIASRAPCPLPSPYARPEAAAAVATAALRCAAYGALRLRVAKVTAAAARPETPTPACLGRPAASRAVAPLVRRAKGPLGIEGARPAILLLALRAPASTGLRDAVAGRGPCAPALVTRPPASSLPFPRPAARARLIAATALAKLIARARALRNAPLQTA